LQSFAGGRDFDSGNLVAAIFGVAVGTILFIILRLRANRRAAAPSGNLIVPWFRKLLPDLSALVPVNHSERLIGMAVAISAGICEEIVFRGWLLTTLRDQIGLTGKSLLWAGAPIFGFAHSYKKFLASFSPASQEHSSACSTSKPVLCSGPFCCMP